MLHIYTHRQTDRQIWSIHETEVLYHVTELAFIQVI